nr:hypothetical protein [Rhizobium leguminosarum bv. viciae]
MNAGNAARLLINDAMTARNMWLPLRRRIEREDCPGKLR